MSYYFIHSLLEHSEQRPGADDEEAGGGRQLRAVALVAHAGAERAHGARVGVLLRLLAALVHLRHPALADDHAAIRMSDINSL